MSRRPKDAHFAPALTELEWTQAVGSLTQQWFAAASSSPNYSIDGSDNNKSNPRWGSVDEHLLRLAKIEFEDGFSTPAGTSRPSARAISNEVAAQSSSQVNSRFLTDLTWLWGQFVDHDIDLTDTHFDAFGDHAEPFHIEVPLGDPEFDPFGTGTQTIAFGRAKYDAETGTDPTNPRMHTNEITSFLDGSVVYGSDEARSNELRTFVGGQLKTSDGELLPFNEAGMPNAGGPGSSLFLAGDVRANENAALSAMHTVWVREHNYWANHFASVDSTLSDEELFSKARAVVTAEIQAITYQEFLPALLGYGSLGRYDGYDASVNPNIAAEFSTAAYRFGHSMLSSELLRLNNDGSQADEGSLDLKDAFFAPGQLIANGIDSLLKGAASQQAQEIDNQVVDDIRNFLFGPPGAGGFDLASLNIQRGRDLGLADYNQTRRDLGLQAIKSFSEITSNASLVEKLEALYGSVEDIDLWVGGLAEDHLPGSSLGETFQTILVDQFERLRSGDSKWFEESLPTELRELVANTSLAKVLERNTNLDSLQTNAFLDPSVFYYRSDQRHPFTDLCLRVNGDQVVLRDMGLNATVARQAWSETSQVHLIGMDKSVDFFQVDLRSVNGEIPKHVIVYGGDNPTNHFELLGSKLVESIQLKQQHILVNDSLIELNQISSVSLDTQGGNDRVTIANGVSIQADTIRNRIGSRMSIGGELTAKGDIRNESQFRIYESAQVTAASYRQSSGYSMINGVLTSRDVKIFNGVLKGDGQILGNTMIAQSARLMLSSSNQSLTFGRSLDVRGRIQSQLESLSARPELEVAGTLTLGKLARWSLSVASDISLSVGSKIALASARRIKGAISSLNVTGLAGFKYQVVNEKLSPEQSQLSVVITDTVEGVFLTNEGVLRINGSNQADKIRVVSNDNVVVTMSGKTYTFAKADVKSLQVMCKGGDDVVDARRSSIAMTVHGGTGNDRIRGSKSNDVLIGGRGNDAIRGMSGSDRLLGNQGADCLVGGGGLDVVNGHGGRDKLIVTGSKNADSVAITKPNSGDRFTLTLEVPKSQDKMTESIVFRSNDRLEIMTGRGNDTVNAMAARNVTGMIDGGPGENRIRAGSNWLIVNG